MATPLLAGAVPAALLVQRLVACAPGGHAVTGYAWSSFVGGWVLVAVAVQHVVFARFEEQNWRRVRLLALRLLACVLASAGLLLLDLHLAGAAAAACRVLVGLLGAVVLLDAVLLCLALEGSSAAALVASTVALSVAEVVGPQLSAIAPLEVLAWRLAAFACMPALGLAAGAWLLPRDEDEVRLPTEKTPLAGTPSPPPPLGRLPPSRPQFGTTLPVVTPPRGALVAPARVLVVADRQLLASVCLIAPAAMLEAAAESRLRLGGAGLGPVFPLALGLLAGGLLAAAFFAVASCWARRAGAGCSLLLVAAIGSAAPIVPGPAILAVLGALLGAAHVAAALLLRQVTCGLGDDMRCVAAAVGVWAAGWQLGAACGLLATHADPQCLPHLAAGVALASVLFGGLSRPAK